MIFLFCCIRHSILQLSAILQATFSLRFLYFSSQSVIESKQKCFNFRNQEEILEFLWMWLTWDWTCLLFSWTFSDDEPRPWVVDLLGSIHVEGLLRESFCWWDSNPSISPGNLGKFHQCTLGLLRGFLREAFFSFP